VLSPETLETAFRRHVVDVWFPRCLDEEHGGFLCDFDRAWNECGPHEKLLEFQARQTWTAALGLVASPGEQRLEHAARHGLAYLDGPMRDREHGGFFHRLDRAGRRLEGETKHAHGAASLISASCVAARALGADAPLELAREAFDWLDEHAHDRRHRGYWGFLARDGTPIRDERSWPHRRDPIGTPVGWKDANVASDLVESFLHLVAVWPDPRVADRLAELVALLTGPLVRPDGLTAFYASGDFDEVRDYVEYGNGLQTAHRLVTAAPILDLALAERAERLLAATVAAAWDPDEGGILYGNHRRTARDKRWWPQFELLRAVLAVSPPDGSVAGVATEAVWGYIERHLLDEEHGGTYTAVPPRSAGGPAGAAQFLRKGDVWKDGYHDGAALFLGARLLREASSEALGRR
jgi:mannobiose 2-epimerase